MHVTITFHDEDLGEESGFSSFLMFDINHFLDLRSSEFSMRKRIINHCTTIYSNEVASDCNITNEKLRAIRDCLNGMELGVE